MASGELAVVRPLERARVVSSVPGRVRLRLASGAASQQRLDAAADALRASAAVSTVTARSQTASVLIEYEAAEAKTLWSLLAQLGLDRSATPETQVQGGIEPAMRVTRTVAVANEVVRRRARGNDLGTLVPLGLALLAMRQFVRDDKRLADAPWYVLASYASGAFHKYQYSREGKRDG